MNESSEFWQKLGIFLDILSKVAAVSAAGLALHLTYTNRDIERQLKELESSQKRLSIVHDSVSFDREFKFKIYQLAVDAIKSKDTSQQEAAYVAVSTMVPDTSFKTGLLGLFAKSKSVTPSIRKAATVARFDIKESKEVNPVFSPKDKIYVDIIYRESVRGTRSVARKILDALQTSDFYEAGIKPLTADRETLPAYQNIDRNLIRYDPGEKAKAKKLMEVVNQILPEGVEPFVIAPTASGKPTVQYVSLFVVK